MLLLSVNIGHARKMTVAKVNGFSGIYKSPVEGEVWISALGVNGDAVCDTQNHGGPDQAVYAYFQPDYAWWDAALMTTLAPGTFGENLTIAGLSSADLNIGDRLHIGQVVLEVTSPRIPCSVLAGRMADPSFVKRFAAADRPGAYCRVIAEGMVSADVPVALERYSGPTLSLVEMFREYFAPALTAAQIARQLSAPIAERARADLAEKPVLTNN